MWQGLVPAAVETPCEQSMQHIVSIDAAPSSYMYVVFQHVFYSVTELGVLRGE